MKESSLLLSLVFSTALQAEGAPTLTEIKLFADPGNGTQIFYERSLLALISNEIANGQIVFFKLKKSSVPGVESTGASYCVDFKDQKARDQFRDLLSYGPNQQNYKLILTEPACP